VPEACWPGFRLELSYLASAPAWFALPAGLLAASSLGHLCFCLFVSLVCVFVCFPFPLSASADLVL
jgi:hypothetical protein